VSAADDDANGDAPSPPPGTPIQYAYPADLVVAVLERLRERGGRLVESPLLRSDLLEMVLSIAYQASLQRDEGRQVIFRLLLSPPESLPVDDGPPSGLHVLPFSDWRAYEVAELRRLAAAAPYHRALLGACVGTNGRPAVWGVVHAGARWLRVQTGGRLSAPALPDALVVGVGGPARIEVSLGDEPIARLEAGRIGGTTLDVFASRWLPEKFIDVRDELLAVHRSQRAHATRPWADLDEDLIRGVAQHMLRQLIAVMRSARHGGTLLIVPSEAEETIRGANELLRLQYRLTEGEGRRRFRALVLRIMGRLAELHGEGHGGGGTDRRPRVGWADYESSTCDVVATLDESMFEVSHVMAGFAAVDGAVVMTKRFEILGFGAEIGGNLPDVPIVARADDVEGTTRTFESTERVGTRHRSAYRLCNALRDAMAVIVSQDGGVRFACWKDDAVTYWHYQSGHLLAG
jgi:hypothetical protein